MKTNKIYIAALAACLLTASGCNDDAFLKESPETFYTVENSFNTTDQVDASITNIYIHARYWFQTDFFLKGLGTDILDTPNWRASGNGYSNFANWSSQYGSVKNVYNAFYQMVAYANLALSGANTDGLTWDKESHKDFDIAQSKFFRGFAYLTLGELFGGVPLVDKVITTPKFDFTRSTRTETYQFAITDLEASLNGLPDYPSKAGYIAKGVAYHYLAEAYLALATINDNNTTYLDKSIEYASDAMKLHSLMTARFGTRSIQGGGTAMNGIDAYRADGDVFFDLFQRGNLDYSEGNTEALWTLENDYAVYHKYGGDNCLTYPRNFAPVLRNANWNSTYKDAGGNASPWNGDVSAYVGGRAVSFCAPTKYVIDGVWTGDLGTDIRNSEINVRRQLKCTDKTSSHYGQVVTKDMLDPTTLDRYYPVWTKFSPIDDWGYEDLVDGGNRSNMYRDEYACRLAETYLLRAEAYLRKGDKKSAAADVNVLRNRAKCTYLVSESDISYSFILDERVRELFGEERRWCTLLRMAGTVVNDQINAHSYYIADYKTGAAISGWNLFPIPQTVIDANLNATIDQNPGW